MAKQFVDFYDLLNLDRTKGTQSLQDLIRHISHEKRMQRNFSKGEKSKELTQIIELCEEALKYFKNDATRKKYDADLAQAVARNENSRRARPKADDLFGNAVEMFNNMRYDMAFELLNELIAETPNNEQAWQLLGDTKYMLGDYDDALKIIDTASQAFPMSINLKFSDIRLNILLDHFNEAQALLNKAIADFPDNPVFVSEQLYLYLAAGKADLAKKFIDDYIKTKPSDSEFRRLTAENLIEIASQNYVIEPESGQHFPITQEKYDLCLKLITWANQIWQDQNTLAALKHIKELGVETFDQTQIKNIIICLIIGIAFAIVAFNGAGNFSGFIKLLCTTPSGVLFAIPLFFAFSIWRKSRRPLWKEYRDILRGYSDADLSSGTS